MESDTVIRMAQGALMHGAGQLFDGLPALIRRIIAEDMWKGRPNDEGVPFSSFYEFCEYPLPKGLGCESFEKLKQFCSGNEECARLLREIETPLAEHGQIGRGRNRVDNIKSTQGGTDQTYALRRLKRDRPDLAEKVVRGELSPNAAAIQAGFRVRTISIPLDPERAARSINKHFAPADRIKLKALIVGSG